MGYKEINNKLQITSEFNNKESNKFYLNSMDLNDIRNSIYVFRSNSLKSYLKYLFDIQIKIKPLVSGISKFMDGDIEIYTRDSVLFKYKYRIEDNCLYVSE